MEKGTVALIAGLFVGVFVGALAYEIIKRNNPDFLTSVKKKISNGMKAATDAFIEGYKGGSTEPEKAPA